MTGPVTDSIIEELEQKIDTFIKHLGDELEDIIDTVEERVRGWVAAVVSDDLSLDEFKSLVEGEKELVEMAALQQKVSAKVLANVFKNLVLEKLVEVVEGKLL